MGFLDKNKVIRLRGDNDRGGREMKIPSYPPLIRGAPKAGDQNGQAIAGRHAGLFTGKWLIGKESAKKLATVFKVDYRVFL